MGRVEGRVLVHKAAPRPVFDGVTVRDEAVRVDAGGLGVLDEKLIARLFEGCGEVAALLLHVERPGAVLFRVRVQARSGLPVGIDGSVPAAEEGVVVDLCRGVLVDAEVVGEAGMLVEELAPLRRVDQAHVLLHQLVLRIRLPRQRHHR